MGRLYLAALAASLVGAIGVSGCTSLLGDFSAASSADGGTPDATTESGAGTRVSDRGTPDATTESGADAGVPDGDAGGTMDGAGGTTDGASGTCASGNLCSPATCQVGFTACDGGNTFCMATNNVANGTICDAGAVCDNGSCVPCDNGATCAEAGSCTAATIVCGSGAPVCTTMGNANDGTSCGLSMVCQTGSCVGCVGGQGCQPTTAPCYLGQLSCDGGVSCASTGKPADAGTSCGANMFCDGNGNCNACVGAGTSCTTNGGCETGIYSCASGSLQCTQTTAVQNGNTCGATTVGGICCGGSCESCPSPVANATPQCTSTNQCTYVCTPPFTTCSGSAMCSNNLSDDPNNCGACGNSCLGEQCQASWCVPTLVGDTIYGGGSGLAINGTTTTPATTLWVTENSSTATNNNSYLESCLTTGCTGSTSNPPTASQVAKGAGAPGWYKIYYDTSAGLVYVGGANTGSPNVNVMAFGSDGILTWSSSDPNGYTYAFVTDNSNLYIADYLGFASVGKTSGGTVKAQYQGASYVRGIDIDSSGNIWLADPNTSEVYRCSTTGTCTGYPTSAASWAIRAVGGTQPYFLTLNALFECDSTTDCSSPIQITSSAGGYDFTWDPNFIYFVDGEGMNLYRCSVSGCASTVTAMGAAGGMVAGMANDLNFVYWLTQTGQIYKVAK